ncbi:Nuclear receptor-binding factor 2 [Takifugu flavidus]|uniref:Nuclear receptor-binding factor 2 n=1 Tax=Takifugu flavidus TaxID=433684 RepID=A0A5C6PQJ9_9TELE|nr:Nuclear receptor-binding factor 2 [Takifugu flavidus]
MKTSKFDQACLSMELQRDSHIKQQKLIQERLKREARREATKAQASVAQTSNTPALLSQTHSSMHGGVKEREFDTLLYQIQRRQTRAAHPLTPPLSGSRTTKDDKTRLEEQQTTIEDLRRLVNHLMDENQRLTADKKRLVAENARLRSESADFVERSELWVLPQAAAVQERRSTGKVGSEIAIPQLPPLEMPAQEDLYMYDLPPLELPEDIENELQELLDRDKM